MHGRLLASTLALLLCALPAQAGESPDTLILQSGERVACELEGESEGFLMARIGTRRYRIERDSLQGAERSGRPMLDEDAVAFVVSLAPHLTGGHAALERATRAALDALGEPRAALIEAAAARTQDPAVRGALRALVEGK